MWSKSHNLCRELRPAPAQVSTQYGLDVTAMAILIVEPGPGPWAQTTQWESHFIPGWKRTHGRKSRSPSLCLFSPFSMGSCAKQVHYRMSEAFLVAGRVRPSGKGHFILPIHCSHQGSVTWDKSVELSEPQQMGDSCSAASWSCGCG